MPVAHELRKRLPPGWLATVVVTGLLASLAGVLAAPPAQGRVPGPVSGEGDPSAAAPTKQTHATAARRRYFATVTVRRAGIKNLPVIRYGGTPDDGPGTVIQNRGILSAPYGRWGGVAPGEVGNLFLAGHRSSHGAPLWKVPGLRRGDKITVVRGGITYVYVVAYRLLANFRSEASKAAQLAVVPGKPGEPATRPAIVLSTCATPEDAAAGLTWRDNFGNPTHRFNVVGFLAGSLAAVSAPTVSGITAASATVSTVVTGGTGPAQATFSYSEDPTFAPAGTVTVPAVDPEPDGHGSQVFSTAITGLKPATVYYVRATVKVSPGITVGPATPFQTASAQSVGGLPAGG